MKISENLKQKILNDHINNNMGRYSIYKKYNISEWTVRKILSEYHENKLENNSDLLKYSVDLELKNQKLRDQQRVERKIRNEYKETNHLQQYIIELKELIEKTHIYNYKPDYTHINTNNVGIIQLSDAHFNEFIDLPSNKYDFDIASKRLKKYSIEIQKYFRLNNINKVLIAFTGDMLNSDRRADEKVSMITSRAKASYFAALLLEQFIKELHIYFPDISISYVVGNESRSYEIGESEIIVSDNYDLTIISFLKIMFKDSNIKFLSSNLIDCIVKIKEKNILFIHGDRLNQKNLSKSIQELKGKYITEGVEIDYVIFGHIHECYISDYYARSGSLCGGNGYSHDRLNLNSRASQNIYIINENSINGIRIDLQDSNNIKGYEWDNNLEIKETIQKKDNIISI